MTALYEEDTAESLKKIYKVEYEKVLLIFLDFAKTECGKSFIGPKAIASVEKSLRILRNADIRIEKY